jgi:hypothetical protein
MNLKKKKIFFKRVPVEDVHSISRKEGLELLDAALQSCSVFNAVAASELPFSKRRQDFF